MGHNAGITHGLTSWELNWLYEKQFKVRSSVGSVGDYGLYGYQRLNDKYCQGVMKAMTDDCLISEIKPQIVLLEELIKGAAYLDKRKLNHFTLEVLDQAEQWIINRRLVLLGLRPSIVEVWDRPPAA